MAAKISYIIEKICKELNIPYKSNNPNLATIKEDAQRLSNFYRTLKEMMGDIFEIEEKYNVPELKSKFEALLQELDQADHDIIRLAKELGDKIKC